MKETKQNLHCLRYLSELVICISIFFSCANHSAKTPENQYKVLEKYFTVTHNYSLGKDIRAIAVLSEQGCPGCNITFEDVFSRQINNPDLLFIITASGNSVDISKYIKSQAGNIFYDSKGDISELFNLKGSSIISVFDQKVDTIITNIDAHNLKSSLDYFTLLGF